MEENYKYYILNFENTENDLILDIGVEVEIGVWPEILDSVELIKITTPKHGIKYVTNDNGVQVHEINRSTPLPDDIDDGIMSCKYLYSEEKGIYENPDWKPFEEGVPLPDQLAKTQASVDYLAMMMDIEIPIE